MTLRRLASTYVWLIRTVFAGDVFARWTKLPTGGLRRVKASVMSWGFVNDGAKALSDTRQRPVDLIV